MAMDVKGITWVGNIYQKFENMCLEEVEDKMFEDAVKYVENQMQSVGESVKKIYSDVMHDLLPPSSCDLDEKITSELPIDQYTDDGFCKKEFQGSENITVKDDTKQTSEDSRINRDNDITLVASCDTDALFDESQKDTKVPASIVVSEITLLETGACRTSQSCEHSNDNQNPAVTVSKPDFAEVTRLASVAASDEDIPNVMVLVKLTEAKEMDKCYSSCALFGDLDETWILDAAKTDTALDHGHKQDNEQKLEETCVMVTRDELRLFPKTAASLKTNKKNTRQSFSLSKKSSRKQEYKELAILHGNNAKGKGDCMENLCPTLMKDQETLLLPDISEAEWELL
ncbi:PREDICTED: uncharacterized protein LOC109358724 isoform X3 [Lupinus angustifolius]|uniref:uncharacterized protein LOC109358724 isoform X3 n=1 Tax=Lupinus angustifolius TaxID=3871 RepID=UPI00092F2ED2|nr:PREDICTED: uncharacterized protein LOC109358724 isoform X3 [Lupinus angustifolius]